MVRELIEQEKIEGMVRLSEINDKNVTEYVESVFREQYLTPAARKDLAQKEEFKIIWNRLSGRTNLSEFSDKIIRTLLENPEETIVVGLNEAHAARLLGPALSRRLNQKNNRHLNLKITSRGFAEKDAYSGDDAGALVAIRAAKQK